MNINTAFPSNYLRATDLQGRNITVVIDRVEKEKVGNDDRLVLYFQNKDKGMILNKTNANNIAALYSPETDGWCGQQLVLFEAMVDFKGQTVPALRVRGPQPKDRVQQPPKQASMPTPSRTFMAGLGQQPAMAPSYPPVDDSDVPF